MPTELEYKFALEISDQLRKKVEKLAQKKQSIEQGYLIFSKGNSARIRKIVNDQKTRWYFTFKQKVSSRVIELEKKIDDRDGRELWENCIGKLKKNRYIMKGKPKWEVDFFYDHSHCYFAMAELELPEGSPPPVVLPDYIEESLIYRVPLTDDRFSNKRLSDVQFAAKLYHSLTNKEVFSENGHKV